MSSKLHCNKSLVIIPYLSEKSQIMGFFYDNLDKVFLNLSWTTVAMNLR